MFQLCYIHQHMKARDTEEAWTSVHLHKLYTSSISSQHKTLFIFAHRQRHITSFRWQRVLATLSALSEWE